MIRTVHVVLGLLALSFPGGTQADVYTVVKEYVGPTFFNDWVFYNNCKYPFSPFLTLLIVSFCF